MRARRITMDAFVVQTGLAKRTINRARGALIVKCQLETLIRIADALEVSVQDLYTYSPGEKGETSEKNEKSL